MYFHSAAFLIFLAVLFVFYFVFKRCQWQLLLAASIIFYAFSGSKYLLYIAATIVTVYIAARNITRLHAEQAELLSGASREEKKAIKEKFKIKRRRWFLLCLAINLGVLAVVKYTAFIVSSISAFIPAVSPESAGFFRFALPLGISFYTFQSLGYLIDVYRGKYAAEENPFRFALFVSFFPQIIQGPISRFDDLKETLFSAHTFNTGEFTAGMRRVLWGFFKKLVIADRLLIAVKALSADTASYHGAFVLVNMFFYAIALYSDFSGGIDITIGVARALGIRIRENFDRPFYSKNIAEYWRRWHITMGTWFRDYLFYPLSVSKPMLRFSKRSREKLGNGFGKRLPVYVSTIILWFATGIWHGASWNFVVWGLANGIVIILSEECSPLYERFHKRFAVGKTRAYQAFQVFRTFWLMSFIRTFDIYRDVPLTFRMFGSILTDFGRLSGFAGLGLSPADYLIAGLGCCVMIAVGVAKNRLGERFDGRPAFGCVALLIVTLVFGVYGVGYDANQFIYNQF